MDDMKIGRRGDDPDFVNDQGVKWWAHSSWAGGQIWITELPNGDREYVGIRNGQLVANSTAQDVIAVKLDMLAAAERYDNLT
jgi:hypothetical protein